ncbi:type IA DNA topoisomerase [Caryophanon latum]|uniref:DNA topoisomerase n=1 Tax=Caryophanon latum TaxID=33977 RepID=A0A1C0YTH0_9BACL|nr:type IA DNA topoisomerase [Caryophanon latum]OCS90478.1 hypothetical protein A6K76_11470 [Caryophanon latum]
MRALLIAEKPSLMRDIQKVYKQMNMELSIDFTSFVGHVVELKEPHEYNAEWKKWDLNVLPMIPSRFEFRVKKTAAKVYREIEQLLKTNRYDFIINACDAGMEGENIFYSFYKKVGCTLPVKRFWTSQTTEPAIRTALTSLLDENDPLIRNLRNAAMYRMVFDWLIGLNCTRIATIKGGRTIKVGRVMTPTLAIVAEREEEIQSFEPKPYFQIELHFGSFKALWFKDKINRFDKKEEAEAVLARITGHAVVASLETERKTIPAPMLHSLLELQKEANKFYGMTSSDTLKIAQSLYEKKLITYPRTESKHLPTNFAQHIERNVQAAQSVPQLQQAVQYIAGQNTSRIMQSKRYVDDKKLTDHHAITLTDVTPKFASLSMAEQRVYELVAKRLLSIFLPPYTFDETTVVLTSGGETFKARGKMVIEKGFTALYETHKKKEELPLPFMQQGDVLSIQQKLILSKMTEPPPRYTDSSLLDAMFHAGRFVEDAKLRAILKDAEGIGTSATRAEIIEKLLAIGMIERDKKSFRATAFGRAVIAQLQGHDVVSPELTAIWSKKLKDIVDGQLSSRDFYADMLAFIHDTTNKLKQLDIAVAQQEVVVLGKCPTCQKRVIEGFKSYHCEDKTCEFFVAKTMLKGKISPTNVKKLLRGDETNDIMFTWKSGKKSKAKLKLNGAKLEFIFPQFPDKEK